ncbi:MAG: alanine/glycine:cation symporter family protein [Janibacter sp.]
MTFADMIEAVNGVVWAIPLVGLCLLAGLYFTVRTGALQVTGLPDMIANLKKGEESPDGTSSFQSLMMSLANRVGMGNIGGVATAITFGGPGAVFWMWVMAFLGAATSFIECTLGQIYKERDPDTGEYRGGPAYYFEKAYRHKAPTFSLVYAIVFAIVTVLAMALFLPGVQANGMSSAINLAWGVPTWATAIVVVILLAFIVIGGVKRIARFASYVVPPMAILFILAALVVFFVNFEDIPMVFGTIFGGAFGTDAVFGGIVGMAIKWGVQRGIYSNEAGQGTGPHHAAAAEVSHPAKQGYVQAFSVYIDTLFVCTATAFIIISTDMYSVFRDETYPGPTVYEGAIGTGVEPGPNYVQHGFDAFAPGLGASFVAVTLACFTFTTMVAYYYMAEVNLAYLSRRIRSGLVRRGLIRGLQLLILLSVGYGAVNTAGSAWGLGDIGVGTMAWLNIVGILVLQRPALKAFKDYREQKKAGLDPDFDPRRLGIEGAEFWEMRADGRVLQGAVGERGE